MDKNDHSIATVVAERPAKREGASHVSWQPRRAAATHWDQELRTFSENQVVLFVKALLKAMV